MFINCISIIILVCILFIALRVSDFEIMSPSCIVIEVFFISYVFSIIFNYKIKHELSGYAIIYISFACLTFILFQALTKSIMYSYMNNNLRSNTNDYEFITSKFFILLMIILGFVCIYLYTYFIIKNLGITSIFNFSEIASSMYFDRDFKRHIPKSIIYIGYISSFIKPFAYILLINILQKKFNNNNRINSYEYSALFIFFFLVSYMALIRGGRVVFFSFWGSIIWVIYIIYHNIKGWGKPLNKRLILIFISLLIIGGFLISGIKPLLGRGSSNTTLHYAGGGITALDWLLENQINYNSEKKECFWALNRKLKNSNKGSISENIFRDSGRFFAQGHELGNVYTPIYRYYHDFGETGIFFIYAITSVIFSSMYYYIKLTKRHGFILIFLATNSTVLFLQGFDDYLVNFLLAPLTIANVLSIVVTIYIVKKFGKLSIKKISIVHRNIYNKNN